MSLQLPPSQDDLLYILLGSSVSIPALVILMKKFLLRLLLSNADLTVVQTYIDLINQLKLTNDHLVEQNEELIIKIKLMEEELAYLKNELIGFGLRKPKPESDNSNLLNCPHNRTGEN